VNPLAGLPGLITGLMLGLVLGSFIAALTSRWPQGLSIARGRSRCDDCGHALGAAELVPVLSHLVQRGRCRHCGKAIAARHLAIELAAAAIGAAAFILQPGPAGWAAALFGWVLLTLAILDVEHFWLPDALTLPLLVAGLGLGLWLAPSLDVRLWGAGAGFASLAAIGAGYGLVTGRDGLGGGDPKLPAAIGAWLGWQALPFVVLAAALLGLALALVDRLRGREVGRLTRVPLGAMLAAAALPLALLPRELLAAMVIPVR